MNERITEHFFREHILNDEAYIGGVINLEEQKSSSKKIDKLLQNASKSGIGKGYPEFIITFDYYPDLVMVVECKADIKKHESVEKENYKDFAVDGVKLYSSFLAKEYDVIAIAVSGIDYSNLKISHFLQLKGTDECYQTPDLKDDRFYSLDEYVDVFKKDDRKFNQDYNDLLSFSKELNDELHGLKIPESDRSLLISACLIALKDEAFYKAYKYQKPKDLVINLYNTVQSKLEELQNNNIEEIMTTYGFLKTHTILSKEENKMKNIIDEIDVRVNSFMRTHKYFDALGQFYVEFLRYANSDKGLGIVLTPPHITELFSDIANINAGSIVLDNCTGTGGFLISAMNKMVADAGGDKFLEQKIKKYQIIGIEFSDKIFPLACSNMYIHGDGRSNLFHGSCFEQKNIENVKKLKPNVGFLNPPYKTRKEDIEELEFVLNNMEMLEKGSYCIAIVPMTCATYTDGIVAELKARILKKHTLEAVLSMPDDLFYNSKVAVNTCIMVFKAKEVHPADYKTYLGYWKNDGFIKIKNIGRTDYNNEWERIKKDWMSNYKNKEEIVGQSVKKVVTSSNEWCAEAYMETNYKALEQSDFVRNIKKYLAYKLTEPNSNINITNKAKDVEEIVLNVDDWKYFDFDVDNNSVFTIKKGKRLTKLDQEQGKIPYISSSALNNGVDNYINNGYTDNNCISFACYGSIGEVFYQQNKAWISDNANAIYLKDRELTPYLAMFFTTVLELEKFRFSYGMTGKKERLRKFKIKLPATPDKKVDYDWIEKYIKSLPFSSNL